MTLFTQIVLFVSVSTVIGKGIRSLKTIPTCRRLMLGLSSTNNLYNGIFYTTL
jgi:hypothetical protein